MEQPLLDPHYAELRGRLEKQAGRKMMPQELLCEMVQEICEHENGYVASGSNQHYKRERCRICQKLMTRSRRPRRTSSPTESVTTDAESVSMGSTRHPLLR